MPPTPVPAPGPCSPACAVCIAPTNLVAPVGTSVVLLAAVRGPGGEYLLTNERVEWSIAPGSAGQFLDVSTNWFSDLLFGEFERGRVGPTYAVATTSRSSFTLTRGTPNPADDVPVLAGQAWVSLTSPVEGISHVTAHAPNVLGWQTNRHTVTVQWVDPRRPQIAISSQPAVAPHRASPLPAAAPIRATPPTTAPGPTTIPSPTTTAPPTQPQARPILEATIQGPNRAAVGSMVSYQIFLTNRGRVPASNLIIRERFDLGLEHSKAKSVIEGELKSLGPGERQAITVDFRVTRAGQLCHSAEIRDSGGILASAQACVTAYESPTSTPPSTGPAVTAPPTTPPLTTPGLTAPPTTPPLTTPGLTAPPTTPPVTQPAPGATTSPLSVQITSPPATTVGDKATLSIKVSNPVGRRLSQVKIAARIDPAWSPKEASEGLRMEGDSLTWTFNLEVNGYILVEILCQAGKPSPRACIRASVTSLEGSGGSGEACTEIREPAKPSPGPAPSLPPELKVTAASLRNPVAEGRELTYEVRVTNAGATPANQVVVTATVPTGMMPLTFGTTGPTQPAIEGQTLRFEPVAEIPPGQTLTYQVRVRTQQSGEFRFHVEAVGRGGSSPFSADATTQVFKAQ